MATDRKRDQRRVRISHHQLANFGMRLNDRSGTRRMRLIKLGLMESGLHRWFSGKIILTGFSARFKLVGNIENYSGGNAAGGGPQLQVRDDSKLNHNGPRASDGI